MRLHAVTRRYIDRLHDVPGFFDPLDADFFSTLADAQRAAGIRGDLLEIGVWYGRSAILLGYLVGEGETLHVSDLFEQPPPTESGRLEFAESNVAPLRRRDFEAWFRFFHERLPVIHEGPSSSLSVGSLGARRFRFVHVDGSHTLENVRHDITLARELVATNGVVAFDDFANVGHLGVAAALWPALADGELEPFACSPAKLYTTLDRECADDYRRAVEDVASRSGLRLRTIELGESRVLAVWPSNPRRSLPARIAGRVRRERARRAVRRLASHVER